MTELAHHFAQAVPVTSVEKAVDYGVRAGQRAMAQLAWEEAVKHFDRARQLSDLYESRDEPQSYRSPRPRRGADPGRRRRGGASNAASCHRECPKLDGPDRLAEAILLFAIGGIGVNEVDDELIRSRGSARGLDLGDSAPAFGRFHGWPVALYYVPGSHDRRKVLCGEAVDIARRLGDPMVLASALGVCHRALWGPDNLEERLAELAECLRLATAQHDEDATFWTRGWRWWLFHSLVEQGDVPAADRQLAIFERFVNQWRDPLDQYMLMHLQSMRALMAGRYAEAEELAAQALPIGQRGLSTQAPHQHHVRKLAALRREQGRLAEVAEHFCADCA